MLLKSADLLMKRRFKLYNNIAKTGDFTGRLSAELQVYPFPRVNWEFECLEEKACQPQVSRDMWVLPDPLVGKGFSIGIPSVTLRLLGSGTPAGYPGLLLAGTAGEARYGDLDSRSRSHRFYLPNARFQWQNLVGQGQLWESITAEERGESWVVREGTAGRVITLPIDDTWTICLITEREALDWLVPAQRNIGTLITTVGELYHPKKDKGESEADGEAPSLTLAEAQRRLEVLSLLLSFANGGYLGPLYIKGIPERRKELEPSASVLAYRTSPLEQIGNCWLWLDSDLAAYARCFATLDRMLSTTPWDEVLDLILIWYFQAIQSQSGQMRGKPWPIVANAVGAALERLSVTILVKELNLEGPKTLRDGIERLLEKIGITKNQGYDDTDHVQSFVDTRRAATHPISTKGALDYQEERILYRAIQWIEEVLLWRLGYDGKYLDRSIAHMASTGPRYDLHTRDPSW